mmetsp:Transcript_13688/g.33485  ORF Transcript_13688/g.33485 Transcript_13688/m.33485 type:complete len:159 (+) Transcript_13688:62-538(+)|eukprot:CAMPEP_0114509938 /NCGR_PEP_ID=MMETSP0109-20121206/13496_1 /TAXON_ID=29199 /ORGANISM="Chlorarachnion reptans, Strain CCCM449" /LENGTH=158 /DNA_ID=CAMNT_0001689163 /DNA_START=289 /DNA_END=765 /DNA_ORIENTATION=-
MCAAALYSSLKKLKILKNKAARDATWDRIKEDMGRVMEQLLSMQSIAKRGERDDGDQNDADNEDEELLAELSESSDSDEVMKTAEAPSTYVDKKTKNSNNERVNFQIESELAKYRAMEVDKEDSKDLLMWWKDNAKLFPTFSVVARTYLGINSFFYCK